MPDGDTLLKSVVHNHAADPGELQSYIVCSDLKTRAGLSRDTPCLIVEDTLASTSLDAIHCIPNRRALLQQVNRIRKLKCGITAGTDVELLATDFAKFPAKSGTFLHKTMSDPATNTTVVVFTTVDNLHDLSRATIWLMDGTFFRKGVTI